MIKMKKLVFMLAAALTVTAATSSFAHDKEKGKKGCAGNGHCCKKEAKVAVKKTAATTKKA
jgi:hypothetical protein